MTNPPRQPTAPAVQEIQIIAVTDEHRQQFRFHPVDKEWQRLASTVVNVPYAVTTFTCSRPHCVLTRPDFATVIPIARDGNCLFRCFSLLVTGKQNYYLAIRLAILSHMPTIAHLLLGEHIPQTSIASYIQETNIWIEMELGAQMLNPHLCSSPADQCVHLYNYVTELGCA